MKIDKDVPLPASSLVWSRMEVGDSVFTINKAEVARARVWAWKNKRKFVHRKITEGEVEGVRIWRVE